MAYPFLFENGRRISTAMICRPSGAITNFRLYLIAGLTSVPGAGWGVMIPQPVHEIYDKVIENNTAIFWALAIGLVITTLFVILLANSLASPLEGLLKSMKANAKEGKLNSSAVDTGLITLTEVAQFKNNYNDMVGRVSEANEKIIAMAFTDVITGLPNREKLAKIADSVLDDYQSQTVGGALIFVDLDDFKQINDVHGHGIGDGFLRICAEKLGTAVCRLQSQCAGLEDEVIKPVIARIGGDEFAILFPGLIEMDNIREFLSLLKMELSTPCDKYPFIRKRSASIGCSCYPKDGLDLEILLKHADIAMYHAKKLGKNRAEIYSDAIGFMTSSPSKNAARPSSR